MLVAEACANDEDEVDEDPDAKAAEGEKHEDARADFAHVESMNAESP